MKQSYLFLRTTIFLSIFSLYSLIKGMEYTPDEKRRKLALVQFDNQEISLDTMFASILPRELMQTIVHTAYGRRFFSFFIASQSLDLFANENMTGSCSWRIRHDETLKKYIKSGKLNPKKFAPFFDSPTAVHRSKQFDNVLMGYDDGNIISYHPNNMPPEDFATQHPFYTRTQPCPITCLIYPEHYDENKLLNPTVIAACANNSLRIVFTNNLYELFIQKTKTPVIAMVATPTILLCATQKKFFLLPEYWTDRYIGHHEATFKRHRIVSDLNIVDIGYRGCMIVAQLENGCFYTLTPYQESDFMGITKGCFSPMQASMIYRCIKKPDTVSLSPEEQKEEGFMTPLLQYVLMKRKPTTDNEKE